MATHSAKSSTILVNCHVHILYIMTVPSLMDNKGSVLFWSYSPLQLLAYGATKLGATSRLQASATPSLRNDKGSVLLRGLQPSAAPSLRNNKSSVLLRGSSPLWPLAYGTTKAWRSYKIQHLSGW